MILAWLMKEDSVKSPTWENLIKALKKPLIGHMGIATTIAKDKGLSGTAGIQYGYVYL